MSDSSALDFSALREEADSLVERGRLARGEKRNADAAEFYEQAAKIFERLGIVTRSMHCLRHSAEIWLQAGEAARAQQQIAVVLQTYREHGADDLEMANTLRVSALVQEAAGDTASARSLWTEAREIYAAEEVQAGIEEADRHLVEKVA